MSPKKRVLMLFYYTMCFASDCRTVSERNCRDLWMYQSIRSSGTYQIDVDGDGPLGALWVECDMGDGRDVHQVWIEVKYLFFLLRPGRPEPHNKEDFKYPRVSQ